MIQIKLKKWLTKQSIMIRMPHIIVARQFITDLTAYLSTTHFHHQTASAHLDGCMTEGLAQLSHLKNM